MAYKYGKQKKHDTHMQNADYYSLYDMLFFVMADFMGKNCD